MDPLVFQNDNIGFPGFPACTQQIVGFFSLGNCMSQPPMVNFFSVGRSFSSGIVGGHRSLHSLSVLLEMSWTMGFIPFPPAFWNKPSPNQAQTARKSALSFYSPSLTRASFYQPSTSAIWWLHHFFSFSCFSEAFKNSCLLPSLLSQLALGASVTELRS